MGVEWVTIGAVTAPHGVRGEVRVLPLTDFPDRFFDLKRVYLLQGQTRSEHRVEGVKSLTRGLFLLKLGGVDSREEAERLRRAEVQVPRSEAVPLPPGRYYVFELVGARVVTVEGEELGVLKDVLTTAANDVYIVEGHDGREILIPAVRHVVLSIDVEGGEIVVDPPLGLLEE